jgi:hypothetical protein
MNGLERAFHIYISRVGEWICASSGMRPVLLMSSYFLHIGIAHAQCEPQVVIVEGYAIYDIPVITIVADDYATTPVAGGGPGGVYSASPNAHVNCTANTLGQALNQGGTSTASQPNNTNLAIPLRYANPIDIPNNSPLGAKNGGINGSAGFMVFPNFAAGTNAALASVSNYAAQGYTIYSIVNTWAPPTINPNTMSNVLSSLGISQSTASATMLSELTSTQLFQLVGAFGWQEGFKPSGC